MAWFELNSDDGLSASHAMLVAAGRIPYRDFFSAEPPLTPLLYGLLIHLAGPSYTAFRALTAVGLLVATGALFAIGRRLLPAPWAAGAAAVWGVNVAYELGHSPYHIWGVAFALVALLLLLRGWYPGAGLAAALAALSEQSMAAAAVAVVLGAAVLGGRRAALAVAGAGGVVALLNLLGLALLGALGQFLEQDVFYVLGTFAHTANRPVPWAPWDLVGTIWQAGAGQIWALLFTWPLAIAAPVLIALWSVLATFTAGWDRRLLVVALASDGLFASALALYHETEFFWFSAPLAVLLTGVAIRRYSGPARGWRALAVAPVGVIAVLGLIPVLTGLQLDCRVGVGRHLAEVAVGGSSVCTRPDQQADFATVGALAAGHDGQPQAFFPTLADFYLLTGRTPPVSYQFIQPGNVTDAQLNQVEDELMRRHVTWVVYQRYDWTLLASSFPDNAALRAGHWSFDDYLQRHYQVVAGDDRFVLYELAG
ncbi:MAG TPA: hypothetical protein VIO84_02315 [Candidatus Dormibacteraeota bacterium]